MELEAINYLKFLFALLFVIGLIGGLALLAKRFGLGNRGPTSKSKTKRLSILETLPLDPKRRVMLIKCDDREHMVLIGPNSEQTLSVTGPETDQPNKISNLSVIGNSQLSSGR